MDTLALEKDIVGYLEGSEQGKIQLLKKLTNLIQAILLQKEKLIDVITAAEFWSKAFKNVQKQHKNQNEKLIFLGVYNECIIKLLKIWKNHSNPSNPVDLTFDRVNEEKEKEKKQKINLSQPKVELKVEPKVQSKIEEKKLEKEKSKQKKRKSTSTRDPEETESDDDDDDDGKKEVQEIKKMKKKRRRRTKEDEKNEKRLTFVYSPAKTPKRGKHRFLSTKTWRYPKSVGSKLVEGDIALFLPSDKEEFSYMGIIENIMPDKEEEEEKTNSRGWKYLVDLKDITPLSGYTKKQFEEDYGFLPRSASRCTFSLRKLILDNIENACKNTKTVQLIKKHIQDVDK